MASSSHSWAGKLQPSESPEPSAAQVEGDASPSLSAHDVGGLKKLDAEIRSSLPQLAGGIVGELTNLLSMIDGHLAADPPNPVTAAEALALIRDELEKCHDSPLAMRLAEKTKPVLTTLGETV